MDETSKFGRDNDRSAGGAPADGGNGTAGGQGGGRRIAAARRAMKLEPPRRIELLTYSRVHPIPMGSSESVKILRYKRIRLKSVRWNTYECRRFFGRLYQESGDGGPISSAIADTIRRMDISMQTTTYGSPEPTHRLKGPRPGHLPLSAKVWDAADRYGKDSQAVVEALYEAVKYLETLPSR